MADLNQVKSLLEDSINGSLYHIALSSPKNPQTMKKIRIRPVLVREKLLFQFEKYENNQVFHENLDQNKAMEQILENFTTKFYQLEGETQTQKFHILSNKKGTITIKKQQKKIDDELMLNGQRLLHNKKKKYLIEEDEPIDFLIALGIQTSDGKIVKSKYDKFRQINRYLEFIDDIFWKLEQESKIRIVDFGSGKSYLTFAMYYYFKIKKGKNVVITGLDLKEKVIEDCNRLAKKLKYETLTFYCGDIADYQGEGKINMVVSLHACDTATDYALYQAVKWNADIILAVPCCQHEINSMIKNDQLQILLQYGLLKERFSALLTDALRAEILEEQGYDTQILEFIDMEHTPKNILIRSVLRKEGEKQKTGTSETQKLLDLFKVDITLRKLFNKGNET